MRQLTEARIFPTRGAADAWLNWYLTRYRPEGYGTRGAVSPNGQPEFPYRVDVTRWTSCD